MGRYTEKDIVYGKRITANGMLAGFVDIPGKDKPQFRFIERRTERSASPKKQIGGSALKRPVSLKTAVQLLRQYYQEKYN